MHIILLLLRHIIYLCAYNITELHDRYCTIKQNNSIHKVKVGNDKYSYVYLFKLRV